MKSPEAVVAKLFSTAIRMCLMRGLSKNAILQHVSEHIDKLTRKTTALDSSLSRVN